MSRVHNHIIFPVLLYSLNFRRTVLLGFFQYWHCLSGLTSILPKSAIGHYPDVVPSFFPNYIFPQRSSILVVQVFFFSCCSPITMHYFLLFLFIWAARFRLLEFTILTVLLGDLHQSRSCSFNILLRSKYMPELRDTGCFCRSQQVFCCPPFRLKT